MIRLGDGVVAGIAGDDLIARIERGAVGAVVMAILRRDGDAALAGGEPPGAADVEQAAVGEVDVVALRCRPGRSACSWLPANDPFDRPKFEVTLGRAHAALEHDVDHAGDGVRAVLRRGAVAQHLDVIDRRHRDRVQIDAGRAAADAAVQVHQRALVPALAVDQHQHLIGTEPAQRRRPHRVGAVGDRRPREIERRRQRLDHLRRLGVAARGNLLVRDDVDRHRLLGRGAGRARSDGHLLGEAEAQRDVDGQRRRVHHDVDVAAAAARARRP